MIWLLGEQISINGVSFDELGNAEASQGVGSFTQSVTNKFQTMLAGNPKILLNFAPPPRGMPSQVFGMPSQPYGMPPYGMHGEWQQGLYGMPPNAYNPHGFTTRPSGSHSTDGARGGVIDGGTDGAGGSGMGGVIGDDHAINL